MSTMSQHGSIKIRLQKEETFGGMIAAELAKLPEFLRIQAKHEINGVIFKFQLQNQQLIQPRKNFAMPSFPPYQPPVSPSNYSFSAYASQVEGSHVGHWLSKISNPEI